MMSVYLNNSKNIYLSSIIYGVIDHGKYQKNASERKWTEIEYPIQDNSDVSHKAVKMYCNTNGFP